MSMFQKRHYEFVAKLLKNKQPKREFGIEWGKWLDIVLQFVEDFRDDNPNFKTTRFLEACGYDEP